MRNLLLEHLSNQILRVVELFNPSLLLHVNSSDSFLYWVSANRSSHGLSRSLILLRSCLSLVNLLEVLGRLLGELLSKKLLLLLFLPELIVELYFLGVPTLVISNLLLQPLSHSLGVALNVKAAFSLHTLSFLGRVEFWLLLLRLILFSFTE